MAFLRRAAVLTVLMLFFAAPTAGAQVTHSNCISAPSLSGGLCPAGSPSTSGQAYCASF
jgi:hypothetical protein